MLFVRLSLINVRRNVSRSLLAILGMALAAGVFTGVSATRTGYTRHASLSYRQFAGADIVGYADSFPLQPSGEHQDFQLELGGDSLTYRYDLATYFPDMVTRPYLKSPGSGFSLDELEELDHPQIRGVYPYLALPVLVLDDRNQVVGKTVLRGRYSTVDEERWDLGYFLPQHEGQLVCVTNSQAAPPGGWGEELRLEVPHIVEHTAGGTVFDYQNRHRFDFQRIGEYAFVVDRETVEDQVIEIFLETRDIFIPQSTWHEIFSVASGGEPLRFVHQAGVTVDSMFWATETQERLAEQLRGATFLAVPELARRAGSMPPAESPDVSSAYVGMAFALSALLASTNMFILVTQRQRELGVLKAIGASGRELFILLLSETALFALVGAVLGFGVVMLFLFLMYLASDATLVQISTLVLKTLSQLMGLALATGLVAGLLPAWYATRSTTVEVLKHE